MKDGDEGGGVSTELRSLVVSAGLSPLFSVPATFFLALVTTIWSSGSGSDDMRGVASAFIVTSIFATGVAYVAMLLLGVPSALLALRKRRPTLPAALFVGSVAGIL